MAANALNSALFEAIRELMSPPELKKRRIGFMAKERAGPAEKIADLISTFREFSKPGSVPRGTLTSTNHDHVFVSFSVFVIHSFR